MIGTAGLLVMVTERGFYFVAALQSPSLEIQAADHGMLNAHVIRVEDVDGNVLWKRHLDA